MKIFSYVAGAALAIGTMTAAPANAVVIHDESVDGDLSDSGLAPTALSFDLGGNEILGSSGASDAGVDLDYFTFTVSPGQSLTAIEVLEGTTSLEALSFIAIQAGAQVTVPPDTTTAAGLLGWWHFSPADIGTDILDDMSIPAEGSSGFTTPLGPGAYAIWIQEANVGTSTYAFNFELAPAAVPEPGTWAVMLAGLALLGWHVRKNGRQLALSFA